MANTGRFIDRSPLKHAAGKSTGVPEQTVSSSMKDNVEDDFIDTLEHEAQIGTEDVSVPPERVTRYKRSIICQNKLEGMRSRWRERCGTTRWGLSTIERAMITINQSTSTRGPISLTGSSSPGQGWTRMARHKKEPVKYTKKEPVKYTKEEPVMNASKIQAGYLDKVKSKLREAPTLI
ncbi:hypothetical protein NQ318_019595 [Aromia moschata]|uniref:Uncharacterized protein n=1 Tax=Aromia moschata TaxID=1265417 RepID=A0AAV8Z3Z2_9CUCU|nr:hypothetical protein NQ318_019595 [Aromia moschata]